MPERPQDAGEPPDVTPKAVRVEGSKIIGIDGSPVGVWVDAGLVGEFGDAVARAIEGAAPGAGTPGAGAPGVIVACWSGSPGATPDDLFPDDPSAWTAGAWAALDGAIDRLAPALGARGMTLLVRPHHRHVVGDVPSVGRLRRALAERGVAGVSVLLDVESMLAESMRARDVADHRRRIGEALRAVAPFEIVYTPDP